MEKLFIVNATAQKQKIILFMRDGRRVRFDIAPGSQEPVGDEFDEEVRSVLLAHIERYGGLNITETSRTPAGFSGLAYRWDRPATESEIERSHEVDQVERQKRSARSMLDGVKAFDGKVRKSKRLARPQSLVTETTIEESAPPGEVLPSGGIRSTIVGDVQGRRLEIA